MLAQATRVHVQITASTHPFMALGVLLAEEHQYPCGLGKSLDGTGQVCHSVPIVGTLMDALLLVTTVHSLKHRQAVLALVMAGLSGLHCPCLLGSAC